MPTLSFKVSAEEARRIRRAARAEKVSVSEFLRRRVNGGEEPPPTYDRVKCPRTGIRLFRSAPGQPPLTTEAVREMLADFP